MGPLLTAAIERAGLADVAARALTGEGLAEEDLARLGSADLLVVGGLANAVRARFRGNRVALPLSHLSRDATPPVPLSHGERGATPDDSGGRALTGAEVLKEIALRRLATPGSQPVGVSSEGLGLQVALVALAYGADEIRVAAPSLSRPDPFSALARMIEEAGRTVVRPVAAQLEVRT